MPTAWRSYYTHYKCKIWVYGWERTRETAPYFNILESLLCRCDTIPPNEDDGEGRNLATYSAPGQKKVPFLSSLLKSSLLTDPFSCTKYTRKRVNFTLLCVTITQINLNRQMLNKLCAEILQRRDVSFLQPKGTIVDPISRRPSSLFNRTNYIIPNLAASD